MKKLFVVVLLIISEYLFAIEYYVLKGDTLTKIANKFSIDVAELVEYNNIEDANKLSIGQKIQIPLDFNRLFSAFVWVESKGNDNAIGDNGNAVGCLQLWPIMVDECNRLANTSYTYDDRKDRRKCKEMFLLLMSYKKVETINQAIKIWNPWSNGNAYRLAYKQRR